MWNLWEKVCLLCGPGRREDASLQCERKLKGIGILDDQVGVHELAKMCGSCDRTLGNHMKTKMIADGGEFTLK